MKKRLTSLLLSVAVTLSAMTIVPLGVSAAKNTKLDEMTAVLSYLDIISNTQGAELDLEQVVDRATFSQMMAAAIKVPYNSGTIYFADVPKDHWAASDINSLTDMGIISLAENRMFEPDRPIKYAEACKMLVCALGYEDFVNAKGGGMERWTAQAADLDIVAGGNAEQITMATAIELIYEAMEAPMLAYESFPHTLVKDEDTTLFGTVHDVYKGRGTVQSAYGAYMSGTPLYTEKKAMVSGDEYNVDEILDMKKFFGHEISFYYVHDDKLDENKIFYAKSRSEDDLLEVNGTFITAFDSSSYTLTYYETEDARRNKTARIEKSAQIVLNGAPYSGSLKDAIDKFINEERRGTITLFSLDGGGYDFVNIQSYEAFIIGAYDSEKMLLSGGFDRKEFDLSDVEVLTVKDELGMDSDIGTIKNTVLNIAASEDNDIIEIIGGPIAMTVKVDSYDGSDKEITCSETTYKVDKRIWDTYAGRFTSLGSIQIKTDMFGYIVDIAGVADDSWRFGFLIRAKCFTEDFGDYQVVFRAYTSDGKIEDLYFAEKVRIDEKSYNLSKNVYAALDALPELTYEVGENDRISMKMAQQIFRYRLNADGKINRLDTINVSDKEKADSSLTRSHFQKKMYPSNKDYNHRLGLDTYVSTTKTLRFIVPEQFNEDGLIYKYATWATPTENDFSVSYSHPTSGDSQTLSVYHTDFSDVYAEVVVAHGATTFSGGSVQPMIYDSMFQVWDEETEEAVNAIRCYEGSKEVEYYLPNEFMETFNSLDMDFGDVFRIGGLSGKYITSIQKKVDAGTSSSELPTFTNGKQHWYESDDSEGIWTDDTNQFFYNYRENFQFEKFYIYKKLSDGIMATYDLYDMYDGKYNVVLKSSNINSIMVVNRDDKTIEPLTFTGLRDYVTGGRTNVVVSITGWQKPALIIYE